MEERETVSFAAGRGNRKGDLSHVRFSSDYDPVTPATDALIAELGLDTHAVRDALADDRARRCPDREVPSDES